MKAAVFLIPIIIAMFFGSLVLPSASAQFQAGGVDKPGTWYAGEGLKKGDYFHYSMCHVDYKECSPFELKMWIKGDVQSGTETKWDTEVVVYDGSKTVVGNMQLGKIAPEPTGGSEELGIYRGAFKSSVVWLSAFATSDGNSGGKGPKAFSAKSWGKIGNIGGEQVVPMAIETITVKAGTWETVQVGWKTGGVTSKVWIVDDFPFPIKAKTFTHVSEGIPPTEYEFELIEYRENVTTTPFADDKSSISGIPEHCDTKFEKEISIKKPTQNFDYQIHAFYGPEDPVEGCIMEWLIKFISKYDDTEFLNQVQFDFLVVDNNLKPLRSIAQEEGSQFLYSPSGQYILDMVVKEKPGTANYVVWVYGLAPKGVVPSTSSDFLKIPVTIYSESGTAPTEAIPEWIKNNAGWWADGAIDDNSFVQGIQFLIKEGIMKIPPTTQGTGGSSQIPAWVKNGAGWWADGIVSDSEFVNGIQFLIKEGIMKIPQAPTKAKTSGYQPCFLC